MSDEAWVGVRAGLRRRFLFVGPAGFAYACAVEIGSANPPSELA